MEHDIPMFKAVGSTAVNLRLDCVYLAQWLELGAPGIERYSFGRFILMLFSVHVCLLYVVLLNGPAERGTPPVGYRVAADSASQSGRSTRKTRRPLVRGFPLAGLLL